MSKSLIVFVFAFFLLPLSFLYWVFDAQQKAERYSFEVLMGKKTRKWRHVQSEETKKTLTLYKNLFEKNKKYLFSNFASKQETIPKVIHFIWLGPKPFPQESKQNVQSWVELHPGWEFKFWTDRERPLPSKKMKLCLTKDLPLQYLDGFLEKTENYGEQSDLLRFEILFREGGLYVDHDGICYKSIEKLHQHYDFYTALEKPHKDIDFASTIFPAICVLGAKSGHPVLLKTMQNIISRWDNIGKLYVQNPTLRVVHRTYESFSLAVQEKVGQQNFCDIVLPASFFFAWDIFSSEQIKFLKKHNLVFAKHLWSSKWTGFTDQNRKEQNYLNPWKKQAKKLHKEIKGVFSLSYLLLALNTFSLGFFTYLKFKK